MTVATGASNTPAPELTEADKVRASIEAKRERLADAQNIGAQAVADTAADIELLQLRAEDARLDAELARAQADNDPAAIAAGNQNNMDIVKRQLAIATGTYESEAPADTATPEVIAAPPIASPVTEKATATSPNKEN